MKTYSLKLTTGSRTVIESFEVIGDTVRVFSCGLSKSVCLPAAFISKTEAREIYRQMVANGWSKI